MNPEAPSISLTNLMKTLCKCEFLLCKIKRRLFFVKDFYRITDERTDGHGDKVKARNDIVQQLVWDTFDMLMNDLVSLCEEIRERGLLNRLKQGRHHFKLLKEDEIETSPPNIIYSGNLTEEDRKRINESSKAHQKQMLIEGQKEALSKISEKSLKRPEFSITEKDVNKFKTDFEAAYKTAKKYRNDVSAHRFENMDSQEPSEIPSLEEVEDIFKEIQAVIGAIRMALDSSSYAYTNLFNADTEETANDLVDMLLFGYSSHVRRKFGIDEAVGDYNAKRETAYTSFLEEVKLRTAKGGNPDA